MITQQYLKSRVNYTPDTGLFVWLPKDVVVNPYNRSWNTRYRNKVAGHMFTRDSGKKYITIKMQGFRLMAHNLAWLYVYGKLPKNIVDHINGDGTDNRICNLRDVTVTENNRNKKLRSNNKTGVCGVYWNKECKKWFSQIRVNTKNIYLGIYESFDDAVKARKEAELVYGFHENHGAVRSL
jgi:hypothetical protein